ncbi:hypothetical protein Vadar_024704 [Vaccinium darrowii]|uniref:Uncharacterized protein n=1 Tax=Vaccinium darrowii TaxID=229202 RepID=A0ACB7Y2B7_9ERIC|nr:hypothetical protein Vadar_024704 [Vaccinium darrowii]
MFASKPTIGVLFRVSRPTKYRHSTNDAFKKRIPTTMSQEPSDRRVVEDSLLRSPNYQKTPFFNFSLKLRWKSRRFSPNTKSGLIAHKKFCLLLASPQPNSSSSWDVNRATLPKFT